VTHDALLREAWGTPHDEDRQTLRAHIANLRRELGPTDWTPLIGTYHGVGYRLTDAPADPLPHTQRLASQACPRALVEREHRHAA
jgi:DNA-binding winged helix-turn-helix (wHTH) protein